MHRLASAATLVLVCIAQSACADVAPPSGPAVVSLDRTVNGVAADRVVKMRDACDPATFDAALGPSSCLRDEGGARVTFAEFNAELARRQEVNAWRFDPPVTGARSGDVLLAVNEGGETHTFTKVAHFGGGFVAPLNAASGNPVPASECLNVPALHIVPPGGSDSHTVGSGDTELYQCCIHPWMRTVVRIHS